MKTCVIWRKSLDKDIGVVHILYNAPGVGVGLCFVSVILVGVGGDQKVLLHNKLYFATVMLRLSYSFRRAFWQHVFSIILQFSVRFHL